MTDTVCSVVMSTFNRAHLLVRSLVCYERQEFPKNLFEVVIVDDGSTDHTAEMVKEWSHSTGIRCTYLTPHPKPKGWRDCAASINHGIRVSTGRHILLTHPEIMVGRTTVLDCVNRLEEFEKHRTPQSPIGVYACARTYYLSPKEQVLLDSVDWLDKGPIAVRDIDRFYEDDVNGHPDFCHRATDIVAQPGSRLPHWQSWIFGGHSRETWKKLGGMLLTDKWGSCDVGWMARRNALHIENYTCPAESAICVHQNHNLPGDVDTPRVEEEWKRELAKFNLTDPNRLTWPYISEIGWGG